MFAQGYVHGGLSVWKQNGPDLARPAHISGWSSCLGPGGGIWGWFPRCPIWVAHIELYTWYRDLPAGFNLSSPFRIALAFTGISLLVVGTTVVGYLPNGR